jgi:hypothetical protein
LKYVGIGIIALILVGFALFGLNYAGYANFAFFAPKYAAVQNQIFHHSPEYTHGMIQQLEHAKAQYILARTLAEKAAMRSDIVDEFEAYRGPLPADLQRFYKKMRFEQDHAEASLANHSAGGAKA